MGNCLNTIQSFRYRIVKGISTLIFSYMFCTFHTILYSITFRVDMVLIDFSLTVKAATLIFISGRGLAISSAKQGISGSIYNLMKN